MNYSTMDQELLAVHQGFKHFDEQLRGRQVIVLTDNQALKSFFKSKNLTRRQLRLQEYLFQFKSTIEYVKGTDNLIADALSRQYENDNQDTVRDPSEYIDVPEDFEPLDVSLGALRTRRAPARFGEADEDINLLAQRFNEDQPWRLCVPSVIYNERDVREVLLEHVHVAHGHLGTHKMLEAVTRQFWWPSVGQDVKEYVRTCPTCQATKRPTSKPLGLLHPLSLPSQPWESVGLDFMGPFQPSRCGDNVYDFLMVVIDQLTGEVELLPTTSKGLDAPEVARLYFTWIFPRHGLPSNIVSDRDVRFTNRFWRALHMHMGTTLSMSSAHHPQSNGKTERMNRTINSILRHFISEEQTDWASMLPMAQYAINSSVSETTGYAPWELNRGYIPRSLGGPLAAISENEPAEVTRFAEHAREALILAQDALISARVRRVHYANQRRSSVADAESHFSVGDLVWLSTRNMSIVPGRTHKWTPKYVGPFEILRSWPATDTFELDLWCVSLIADPPCSNPNRSFLFFFPPSVLGEAVRCFSFCSRGGGGRWSERSDENFFFSVGPRTAKLKYRQ
jgi:transposase InsO family protein